MTKTPSNVSKLEPTFTQAVQNNFNGAAIIDEFGNEIPITETMIQHACTALTDSWKFPSLKQQGYSNTAQAL